MPKPNQRPPGPWLLPRIAAVLVTFLTLVACGLESMGISTGVNLYPDKFGPLPSAVAIVVVTLAGGLGLAAVLECLARLGAGIKSDQSTATAAVDETAFASIVESLARLEESLPISIADSIMASFPAPAETAGSDTAGIEQHLATMVKLLEEMKEVSMLDDSQRQTRRQQIVARRKVSRLEEVDRLISSRSWQETDALLHLLESLHPGDTEVQARRGRMDESRGSQLATDWEQLSRQVEDQMALGRFAEALQLVSVFHQSYPTHQPAVDLADRVRREADVYTDRAVTRAFEEIKSAVETRQWRSALMGTQTFLQRFPDHPRSDRIRQQLRVIQKNAEIEERQEQEEQINQLIKSRRYAEALAAGEDLVSRFPDSPQATRMSEILPRLREKAAETEGVVVQD